MTKIKKAKYFFDEYSDVIKVALFSLYYTPCMKVTAAESVNKAHMTLSWFYFATASAIRQGLRCVVHSYPYVYAK